MNAAKILCIAPLLALATTAVADAKDLTGKITKVKADEKEIQIEGKEGDKSWSHTLTAEGANLNGFTLQCLTGWTFKVDADEASEGPWKLNEILDVVFEPGQQVAAKGWLREDVSPDTRAVKIKCDPSSICVNAPLDLSVDNRTAFSKRAVSASSYTPVRFVYVPGANGGRLVSIQRADEVRDDPFSASGYVGVGIDSFAAQEHALYLNPDASGDIESRYVAGFDFEYRLLGKSDGRQSLWIYGETVHGVRSADVDCTSDPKNDICVDNGFGQANTGNAALAIVRNASSLEAFVGLRWEFHEFQGKSASSARLYAKAEAGFLTVTGDDDDAVDMNQLAVGLRAAKGRFENSFFQVGWGTTDLFEQHPNGRYKIGGLLSWKAAAFQKAGMSPFVEFVGDFDLDNGADSIQTYYGLDFDLDLLFGGGSKWFRLGK